MFRKLIVGVLLAALAAPVLAGFFTTAQGGSSLPDTAGQNGKVLGVVGTTPTWVATSGVGTVTSVSGVTSNGFNIAVANPTAAPIITISTTITGPLKGATGALALATAADITGLWTTCSTNVMLGGGTCLALGTNVQTALGVAVGSAGAVVVLNGAGGTPSAINLTNGTALPLTTGVTGDLPFANLAQLAANTVAANPTTGTADVQGVALAVSQVLCRANAGNVSACSLGTNLSMTGSTINATGGAGSPGGAVSTVQYNNAGTFAGFGNYDPTTGVFTTTSAVFTSSVSAPNIYTSSATPVAGAIPWFTSATNLSATIALTSGTPVCGGGTGAPTPCTVGTGVMTALGINVGSAGAFVTFNGALGTPSSGTASNLTGLPISTGVSGLGAGVATAAAIAPSGAGGFAVLIASGTVTLGTGAVTAGACVTPVSATATGATVSSVVNASFDGNPTAITGYIPSISGALSIFAYPAANVAAFQVCNYTATSLTPGAVRLNWQVIR